LTSTTPSIFATSVSTLTRQSPQLIPGKEQRTLVGFRQRHAAGVGPFGLKMKAECLTKKADGRLL
jgi:hypothetical protein